MNKETFEQMVLRIADDQSLIWREGCSYESGILSEEAISFATAIWNGLVMGTEPIAWIDTYGVLWPKTIDGAAVQYSPLFTYPPSAVTHIAELEKQRDKLLAALKALTNSLDYEDLLHDDQRTAWNQACAIINSVKGGEK